MVVACATGTGGAPRPGASVPHIEGFKALYDARSVTPAKTHRFRLALALAPDRMRMEVLPPVGGPRLVVTADGRRLMALDPQKRRAEIWNPEQDGVARLLGAAIAASDLRTLLEGRSPCGHAGEPAQDDRSCPFGGGRYRPGPAGDADTLRSATLLDAAGTPLLYLEYPPPGPAEGEWWRSIVLKRPAGASTIRLTLVSGPTRADLDPALFSTEPPERFESGEVLGDSGLSGTDVGEAQAP